MAESYIGEIRMFGGNFAPLGWSLCDGALLPVNQNEALFALIGTTYGGDGQETFALPNLQGRLPVHQGTGYALGNAGGSETAVVTTPQVASHSHPFLGSTGPGAQRTPAGNVAAAIVAGSAYVQDPATAALASDSVQAAPGGNQPHDNVQPFLCVTFIIALYGIFPPRT